MAVLRTIQTDLDGMSLPVGKTCEDCRRRDRCTALFGIDPANEVCDFAPSMFESVCEYCDDTGSILLEAEHPQWVACSCRV
jgi:hypothetical protein